MSWYLGVPGYLAALLFHHERRVPSLRPEHLAFHRLDRGPTPDSIAVLDTRFVCLPDDPAAAQPRRDRRARRAARWRRCCGAGSPRTRPGSSTAFAPTVRFGRHTLWAAATDALDDSMLLAGRYGGDEGAGVLDAALLLAGRGSAR